VLKTIKNLRAEDVSFCWYGPRSTDVSELDKFLKIEGNISCYGPNIARNQPMLTSELPKERNKFSIDNLAKKLMGENRLLAFIEKNNIHSILPYDTNHELEIFCKENNIKLLSSTDEVKDYLRDKTKIDEISRAIGLQTIPGVPGTIDDFEFEPLVKEFGKPLFLHFAEGAGGTGNRIVSSKEEFEKVKLEQKGKRLNVKKYFVGKTCTIDICVTPNEVICGTLEEELIGAEPLSSNSTEYVGSSWFGNSYSYELRKKISDIGVALGNFARKEGFLGCFHPDFLIGKDDGIFLTELNMRFGGSCGAYTKIQSVSGQTPLFVLHALTFIRPELEFDSKNINEQNLKALNYSLLVLKNNFGKSIKISSQHKSGLYKILDKNISFSKKAKLSDLKTRKDVLLVGLPDSEEDTIIGEGAFICEVLIRFPVSDLNSKLNIKGKALVEKIFSTIIF